MVTTEHKRQLINSGKVNYFTKEPIMKPDCVVDYNKNMHFVDKADMQISSVECVRKTAKWHKKLFFHLLDIVMLNVYNMFRVKTEKKSSLCLFSKAVLKQIITKLGSPVLMKGGWQSQGQLDRLSAAVFMQRNYPCPLPLMDKGRQNRGIVMFA